MEATVTQVWAVLFAHPATVLADAVEGALCRVPARELPLAEALSPLVADAFHLELNAMAKQTPAAIRLTSASAARHTGRATMQMSHALPRMMNIARLLIREI